MAKTEQQLNDAIDSLRIQHLAIESRIKMLEMTIAQHQQAIERRKAELRRIEELIDKKCIEVLAKKQDDKEAKKKE